MNAFLAACIALLFSGWVWQLKHELSVTMGQLALAGQDPQPGPMQARRTESHIIRHDPPVTMVEDRPEHRNGAARTTSMSANRRWDGVRTFEIS